MPRRSRRYIKYNGPATIILLILLALLAVAQMYLEEDIQDTSAPPPVTENTASGSIAVYFSDPLSGRESGGPENYLIQSINAAQRTVDMAIYNLSLQNVADALLKAQERGVQVRLVMESEAMDRTVPQELMDAGIPIIGDQREGLMHNKFVIIDGQQVWTGSLNLTNTGAYQDFNNLIMFRSTKMAENYETEFSEMFDEDLFGPADRPATPNPSITLDGVRVETYFSPDDKVSEKVERALSQAQDSIDFMVYSFTSDPIADVLLERSAAGVQVRGVFDEGQSKGQGSEDVKLREAGIEVRIDGIPGLLHHKVFIIDGEVVITGSYNFSASAERRNDENLVIVYDRALAQQYLQEFQRVYDSAID